MGTAETPLDELTGLPLLIVPNEDVLPILFGLEPSRTPNGHPIADWNHIWHPRKEAQFGTGGLGLRHSRVQFVMRSEHDTYHEQFYGPSLPQKPAERFEATVLCAAGYIPRDAISIDSGSHSIVRLNEWERTRLHESGEVRIANFKIVQDAIRDYVLAQPLNHIRAHTIDRFLQVDPSDGTDAAREHRYLAHLLLSLVIDQVEDHPVAKSYASAHESGLLAPDAPDRFDEFILKVLRTHRHLGKASSELTKRLTRHREVELKFGSLALAEPASP
ncbi:MAG TPA: hypothetical protein VLA92_01670 [Candidatus Saccharimonadales bacterium]|nr:hypothetical protein [Candidatus Saccharimonadales bacterium]